MKKVLILTFSFIICFNFSLLSAGDYQETELFFLKWGSNNSEVPYYIDNEGVIHGPTKLGVDENENIYFSLPYSEYYKSQFRKYSPAGVLLFNIGVNVYRYAVDKSENVYFVDFNKSGMNQLELIDKGGNITNTYYSLEQNNQNAPIRWIKNQDGFIVYGNKNGARKIIAGKAVKVSNSSKDYMDSKNRSYYSETDMAMSDLSDKSNYNSTYVNLIKYEVEDNAFFGYDTTRLEICRFPHKSSEVIGIDAKDNYYFWIYYGDDKPIDIVAIDSLNNELARVELIPPSIRSFGIWMKRPIVTSKGKIYEFRCLDDGLHLIRWSRKE